MNIVLTGGSGLIGKAIATKLLADGHTVITIARTGPGLTHERLYFISCDLERDPLPYNILERTDAVIHLAGEPILQKWTPEVQRSIAESRIKSTKHVVESIIGATSRPPVFICASATGFYGDTGESVVDEQSLNGTGFLAETVIQWEAEARKVSEYGVRVVLMRTAPVLGNKGILPLITRTVQFGFLTAITKKNFWFSWIHEKDVVRAYLFALETTTLQGVVNTVAPEPIQYRDFMKIVAKVFHRRVLCTIPGWILRIRFGALVDEMVRDSAVAPKRLLDKGFTFEYPTLTQALTQIADETK